MRFARTAKADFDPWATRDAGLIIQGSYTMTDPVTGVASILQFRGQIDQVQEVDIEGDYGIEITGPCIASDTGGDEFIIQFANTP